ncbi:unnamed protein product [Jaminaea pallidilutea]
MAAKDNANPTVYKPSATTGSSGPSAASGSSLASSTDWWRDESVHVASIQYGDGDEDEDGHDSGVEVMDVDGKVKMEKRQEIDADEVFDLIRSVTDPEHPLTLEELAVVNASHITVTKPDDFPAAPPYPAVRLEFTPTIPHCSMATLIGLSLRVRLLHALPPAYKVDIYIRPGTHQSEKAINKQLNDKERVAAALENESLFGVVKGCLESAGRRGKTEEEWNRKAEELAKELGVAV